MLNRKRAQSLITGAVIFLILIVIGKGLRPKLAIIDSETQHRFREVALASVNAERKAKGIEIEVVMDSDLQEWLDSQPESVIHGDKNLSPDLFLKRLPNQKFTLSQASISSISAESPGSLARQLDLWEEALKASNNVVAIRLYRQSNKSIGCILLAARKVPAFNLSLFNSGQREFYVTCKKCNASHLGQLERCDLAIVVKCSQCNHSYDLIAADIVGKYHRATHYLQGYSPPQGIGVTAKTRIQEISDLWSEVAQHCRYSKDFTGMVGQKDSWQVPADTYSLRNGDCEDTALLLADWLISRGFNARVVIGLAHGKGEHAWCVTELNGKQYLLETTLETIPDILPETQQSSVHYRPLYAFNRHSIYFLKEPVDIVSDYFSPQRWASYTYPLPANPSVASMELLSPKTGETPQSH